MDLYNSTDGPLYRELSDEFLLFKGFMRVNHWFFIQGSFVCVIWIQVHSQFFCVYLVYLRLHFKR